MKFLFPIGVKHLQDLKSIDDVGDNYSMTDWISWIFLNHLKNSLVFHCLLTKLKCLDILTKFFFCDILRKLALFSQSFEIKFTSFFFFAKICILFLDFWWILHYFSWVFLTKFACFINFLMKNSFFASFDENCVCGGWGFYPV